MDSDFHTCWKYNKFKPAKSIERSPLRHKYKGYKIMFVVFAKKCMETHKKKGKKRGK